MQLTLPFPMSALFPLEAPMQNHADPHYVAGFVTGIRFAALAVGFGLSAVFFATL
jgi:hypothetical protein